MKKVLITGSNGLLGQKLIDLYLEQDNVELVATSRGANRYPGTGNYTYRSLDITNKEEVNEVLSSEMPDCIINTAAMTNVDACENDKEGCKALNIEAVRYLVDAANSCLAHFIHLSTDFIFNGESGPYSETDEPDPLSYYGWSKLEAERIIEEECNDWSIARTILVYGIVADMSRSNIVLWAKGALEKGEPIKVVNDQYRMPTLAEDLAKGCQIIETKHANGIFHISGKDFMPITELVRRVSKFYDLDDDIIEEISSETLNQAAKRPPITGFDLSKSQSVLGYNPHSFEEGLEILQEQLEASF
ncbi:SDR family oxidoreductase [bacterium]|nr:SDR family oxidoreductase [bacterium]